MTQPITYHETDVQAALIDFDMAFEQALRSPGPIWAPGLGKYHQTNALKTTYPIPIGAAGFKEFKDEFTFRSLSEKSLTLTQQLWADGVEELAYKIEAQDFVGFAMEPAVMADAAMRAPNEWVATALEANDAHEYDGNAFFYATHKQNPFKGSTTFSNLNTTKPLNLTNLELAKTNFRGIKGPNGKSMGLELTHIVVPTALMETALDLRDRKLVILGAADTASAVDSRHAGTFQVVHAPELSDANDWYALALNRPGLYPWIVQVGNGGSPERIIHDKTSSKYKNTLKVGISMVLKGTAGLGLPHVCQKFTN